MTDLYYYGDLTRRQQRNVDRERSRENAGNTSHVNSDREYMTQLGKEGIKRQQEHMLSKEADEEGNYANAAADKEQAAYSKAYFKKRAARKAARKR